MTGKPSQTRQGPAPDASPVGGVRPGLWHDRNLLVVYTVTLMAVLGVSSVTPAFPDIVEAFGIAPSQVGLLITAFTIPGVVLTPVLGVLADRFGRKRILIPALLLFAVAGVACAFARDFTVLLVLRLFQGTGAASLGAINITLIGDLYGGRERTAAMGYTSSVLSIGTATYPLIGGALAAIAWHVPFYLPALAVPVAGLVLWVMDSPQVKSEQRLGEYLRRAWTAVSDRRVLLLFGLNVTVFILLFGTYLTFFPIFVSERFGGSSTIIGVLMATASVTTALMSANLGRLTARFSEQALLRTALISYVLSLGLIPFAPSLWWLVGTGVLFGTGHGLVIPILLTLITSAAPAEQRAAVMAANGMVLRIGQTLGPVIMGGVHDLFGLEMTFYAGSAMAVGLLLTVAVLRPARHAPVG